MAGLLWTTKKTRHAASSRGISFSAPQRQPAFDTFDGSLFAVLPSLSEEQTLQEVPTGLDSVSHGNLFSTLTDGAGLPSLGSRVNKDTRSVNRDRSFSSQECQYLEYWV